MFTSFMKCYLNIFLLTRSFKKEETEELAFLFY